MKKLLVVSLLLALPVFAQSEEELVAWARTRMVPPGELRALDPAIKRAKLIGVGESVHDTAEFFAWRQQLLQDLVRRHRVTALVLESGLPEAMALNDYVRGRTATIDYDAALPGGYGSLATIRETMEWLRAWNLGEGRTRPVSVYGADFSNRSGSMVPALDRLLALTASDDVVKRLVESIRPIATQTAARWWKGAADKYAALSPEAKSALTRDVGLLAERVQHRDQGAAADVATLLQQNEAALRLGMFDPSGPRDVALAENTLRIVRTLGDDDRAVYWAHNAHVQKVPVQGKPLPPGQFIGSGLRFDVVLGDAYVAIATAYGGPARDDASAPAEGSVDAALAKVSAKPFLLMLKDGPAWLSEERPMRFQVGYLDVAAGRAFDAIAYFDRATAATRVTKP